MSTSDPAVLTFTMYQRASSALKKLHSTSPRSRTGNNVQIRRRLLLLPHVFHHTAGLMAVRISTGIKLPSFLADVSDCSGCLEERAFPLQKPLPSRPNPGAQQMMRSGWRRLLCLALTALYGSGMEAPLTRHVVLPSILSIFTCCSSSTAEQIAKYVISGTNLFLYSV